MYNPLNNSQKRENCCSILFFLMGVGSILGLAVNLIPLSVYAQSSISDMDNETQLKTQNNTLFVSGFATEKAKTDLVTISIGVQSTNKSATDALITNSHIASEIISTLKQNGVSDNEISTSQYSIQPNYNYSEYGNIINTTGFTISNIVSVQSPNLNNVSQWIDSAVNAGANTISSVEFQISPKSLGEVKKTLIDQAIADARQKAEIASKAVGSSITGIKSISVNTDGFNPLPVNNHILQKSLASDFSSTPIIPGQQDVSIIVQIEYLLN